MKKTIFICLALMLAVTMAGAQKFAYVDSQYILDNIPEYAEAQAQIDELSQEWQKEIEARFAEVDKMYQDYQAQSVLLPEDMKKKKEQEIVDKEREAKNLQKTRYGKDGDLFKKRQELIKPIQEKIYNAIQEIATDGNYSIVFDKAGSLSIMYANPKYDISDDVLDNLGAAATNRKRSQTPSTTPSQSQTPAQQQQAKPQSGGDESKPPTERK
jgi:outer membrane protein